jgi:hypothetical protein
MDSFLQNVFIIHNKKFYTIDSQSKDEGWAFSMELMLTARDENAFAMMKCKHYTRKRTDEPASLTSESLVIDAFKLKAHPLWFASIS